MLTSGVNILTILFLNRRSPGGLDSARHELVTCRVADRRVFAEATK